MQIQSERQGELGAVLVVSMPATVVDETAEPIREAVEGNLPDSEGAGAVLDCASVELINSIGITCLLQIQDFCRRRSAAFVLAAVPEPIRAFLGQLRLDKRFEMADSVEEAVRAVESRAGGRG